MKPQNILEQDFIIILFMYAKFFQKPSKKNTLILKYFSMYKYLYFYGIRMQIMQLYFNNYTYLND